MIRLLFQPAARRNPIHSVRTNNVFATLFVLLINTPRPKSIKNFLVISNHQDTDMNRVQFNFNDSSWAIISDFTLSFLHHPATNLSTTFELKESICNIFVKKNYVVVKIEKCFFCDFHCEQFYILKKKIHTHTHNER